MQQAGPDMHHAPDAAHAWQLAAVLPWQVPRACYHAPPVPLPLPLMCLLGVHAWQLHGACGGWTQLWWQLLVTLGGCRPHCQLGCAQLIQLQCRLHLQHPLA